MSILSRWNLKPVTGTVKFPNMTIAELYFGNSFYYTSSMTTEKAEKFLAKLEIGLSFEHVNRMLVINGEELKYSRIAL